MMWLRRPSPSINSTIWSSCFCVEPGFMTTIMDSSRAACGVARTASCDLPRRERQSGNRYGEFWITEKKGSLGEIDAETPYKLRLHPTAARRPLWEQPPLVTTTH